MSTTDGRTQETAMLRTTRRQFVAGALALPALAGTATAQVTSIRLGKQYGLPFLPQMVMEAQKLIEKHAGALGLGRR
jgi:NitT/TauT family transport system substrate-binding protein